MIKKIVKKALLLQLSVLFSCLLCAQQKTVTGKINDPDGKPLAGINITIKGSTVGTATDENGAFSIVVPANESVLKISGSGYVYQEITVGTRTTISLNLQRDTKQLDDVVVIGYGTQRVRAVTGSIASIDTKKLEDLPVSSLAEMLRGQVPGLDVSGGSQRPGAMATLSIRQQFNWGKDGGGTIPLIIIDDVVQIDPATNLPTLDKFNLLDLSEVESISVLRDGSAAIYGARASQGAIVVKTKRGKIGPPKITYSAKFETNNAISHGKVMNAKEYGIFSNRLQRGLQNTIAGQPNKFFTNAELAGLDSLNYDWLGNDWNRANAMQHSINVSGGSERATYFTGASYYTQGANLGEQDFNRWTFRSGTEVKIVNSVKFSATVNANSSNLEKSFTKINFSDGYANGGEQNDYSVLLHMPKYIPWQLNVGGVDRYISPVLGLDKTGAVSGNNSLSNWNYYAMLANGSKTTNKTFGYNANFSLQYDLPFIKGLSVRGNYSIGSTASNTEQVQLPLILSQATNANTAGNHLYGSPTVTWSHGVINRSNSRITYDNTNGTLEQINFFANYDHNFGNHSVSAVFSGERSKVTSEDRFQIYDNPLPGIYNGTSPTGGGTINASNSITYRQEGGTMSYFGRVNYGFKNKYFAQFVFRTDASSKFAPENYWGFFPNLSLGWVVSDEPFFKKRIKAINYLKLRGSFGKTGNDNVKAWKWMQLYELATDKGMAFGTAGGNYTYGLTPLASPNRDIKWDRTIQRNVGIDAKLLRNRLSLSIDGYYNSGKDLLTVMTGAINVPISAGGAFAEQNYGAVDFWGTEISATWDGKIGKDLNFSIGVNFALSDNKVKTYLDQPFSYPSTYAGKLQQGYSLIGAQWGFKTWKETSQGDGILRTEADLDAYWAYLTNLATQAGGAPKYFDVTTRATLRKGTLAYQDLGGALDANTRTIAGPNGQIIDDGQDLAKLKNRTRSYGFTTNLGVTWKSISLLAQISTSWGGYNSIDRIKQGTSSTNAGWSQMPYLNDMYDSTDNPNGKYPNMAFYDQAYKTSDFWELPTFRCVVRSLSIGYTLPQAWIKKVHMSNAKLVLSGYNLWDLYNPYPGKYRNMYDNPNVNYPTLRTWALGVNVGF